MDNVDITKTDLANNRSPDEYGLMSINGGYVPYFTNGDMFISARKWSDDKDVALYQLKNIMLDYWREKNGSMKMGFLDQTIRYASDMELAGLANRIDEELEARGLLRPDREYNEPDTRLRHLEDYIWNCYQRRDLNDECTPKST